MCVNSEQMASCRIAPCHHEICADVSLVPEEMLFEHCHDCNDARFTAGREGVEFEVGGDQGGGEFGVGCCAGAGAPDLRGDVVEFLTILAGEFIVSTISWLIVYFKAFAAVLPHYAQPGMECTLSATIGPLVARVSAAITTPPL